MPASDVKFGISRHTGALVDSVETDDSVQVKELPGIRKGQRFALVPFDATAERRQELLTALEK